MTDDRHTLAFLSGELSAELQWGILPFWERLSDLVGGGYYGRVDSAGLVHKRADRSAAMYGGIVHAFSAAYSLFGDGRYLLAAHTAQEYISSRFLDRERGGVCRSVNHLGEPVDANRHAHAHSMVIGGLCEFHKAEGNPSALDAAYSLEEYLWAELRDPLHGGFYEVAAPQGGADEGEKHLFTQLQVLDGCLTLHALRPSAQSAGRVEGLAELLLTRMFDRESGQPHMVFSRDWSAARGQAGFAGLIIVSTLLRRAGEALGAPHWSGEAERIALLSLDEFLSRGEAPSGGSLFGQPIEAAKWWLYPRAMTGYFDAYRLSGDNRWLAACLKLWKYINNRLADRSGGEWFTGAEPGTSAEWADKAGAWKSPEAPAQMCAEIIRMISEMDE